MAACTAPCAHLAGQDLSPGYPAEAFISLNGKRRKKMSDEITTTSKVRLARQLGIVSPGDVNSVIQAVRLQPGL